ncbi:DUF1289 domain-containing protein [Sphingomonas sp. RS2018]
MDDDLFAYEAPIRLDSPCTGVCRLDTATGWCRGCGRTGAEIGAWTTLGDEGRHTVLAKLPARMTTLGECKA